MAAVMSNEKIKEARHAIHVWLEATSFGEFAEIIEKRIIGQKELRPLLFVIYNYLECIAYERPINHNILLAGPSGCGKTELYRTLRDYFEKELNLSVTCVDLSSITTAGFKGADPGTILEPYATSGKDYGFGFIFMDEFDKRLIPQSASSSGITSNVSVEVQNNLLKIVEGSEVNVEKLKRVNTEKLCFIGMGSFDHVRKKRMESEKMTAFIGFNREKDNEKLAERKDIYLPVTKEDATEYGATVELMARFPFFYNFKPLEEEQLLPLIEKVRKRIEDSLIRAKIMLETPMIEYLKENCRTEYGVRKVDELLRGKVMQAYMEATMLYTDSVKNKMLLLTFETQEDYHIEFREFTKEEKKMVNSPLSTGLEPCELDEKIDDGIKDIWKGDSCYVQG